MWYFRVGTVTQAAEDRRLTEKCYACKLCASLYIKLNIYCLCKFLTGNYSLEDPSLFELLSLSSSIPVISNRILKKATSESVDQRPSDT